MFTLYTNWWAVCNKKMSSRDFFKKPLENSCEKRDCACCYFPSSGKTSHNDTLSAIGPSAFRIEGRLFPLDSSHCTEWRYGLGRGTPYQGLLFTANEVELEGGADVTHDVAAKTEGGAWAYLV